MAYLDERKLSGRRATTLVEIQADFCNRSWGVAPCTATGDPGTQCFNSFGTCQDTPNYSKGTKSYWFINNKSDVPIGENMFPTIENVNISPSKIDRNDVLGAIGKATITMRDFTYHDRGIDPYHATRTSNPNLPSGWLQEENGTFFGRFLARNPHLEGRICKIYTGYIGDAGFNLNDFESRTYVIDRINGPDRKGKVTLILKDLLKFTNDERAQAPGFTSGELTADMPATMTSGQFSVTDGTGYSIAINTTLGAISPAARYIRINNEIIQFSRSSVTLFNVIQRGAFGSEISDHDKDDTVQWCAYYENMNIVDILYDLVSNPFHANIPSTYIDIPEWIAVKNDFQATSIVTTLITEPESVYKLVSEIMQQFNMFIVWREKEEKVKLGSNVNMQSCLDDQNNFVFNSDDHIIEDSVQIKRLPQNRINSVRIYYDVRSYVERLDEANNFRRVSQFIDADAQSANASNDKKVKVIYSRWLRFSNLALVTTLQTRLVNRRKRSPVQITWDMDAKDSDKWTGDFVQVRALEQQDEFGQLFSPAMQIISVKEHFPGATRYTYIAEGDTVPELNAVKFACIAPAGSPDYGAATDQQRCEYGFIGSPNDFDDNQCYRIL